MNHTLKLEERDGGVLLPVAARPGASRSEVQGVHDGALKVAVGAPPERGKANKELLAFLAKRLGLRRAQLELVSGDTSRSKTVRIEGVGADELRRRLVWVLGD